MNAVMHGAKALKVAADAQHDRTWPAGLRNGPDIT